MISPRIARARQVLLRGIGITFVVVVLATAAACPFAGRYLVLDEPLERADVIVVLAGEQVERWLEGVDLFTEGYAPQLLLSPGYEEPLVDQLRRRGVRFPRLVDMQRDAIVQLGVPADAVDIMPGGYDNTADEALGVHRIAEQRGWKRVIVVTSQYHTRRSDFAFRRELRDTGIDVQVKGTRYDRVSPRDWWRHRSDLRMVTMEWQKLLLYRLGLGK